MNTRTKRVSIVALIAMFFIALVSAFTFMRTSASAEEETTPSDNGITMHIDAVGTPVVRTGSAGNGWLQVPVRFEGSADGLSLKDGHDTNDLLGFVNETTNKTLMEEDANYLSKIMIGADNNGVVSEKCITEYIHKGIDWVGIFDGGKLVFAASHNHVAYPTNIRYITFKAGFTWYTGPANAPVKIEATALTKDVSFWTDGYGTDGHFIDTMWQEHATALTVEHAPTTVPQGELIDYSDMVVKATVDSGEKTLTPEEYTVSECDTMVRGTHPMTVKYQDKVYDFEIEVGAPLKTLQSITLNKTAITGRRYETPDLEGLIATLHFDDNTTREIPVTKEMLTCDTWGEPGSALSTIASQTATVSYTHVADTKSADIALTVTEPDLTTGMFAVYENADAGAKDNSKNIKLPFTFTGVSDDTTSADISQIDLREGAHVADYLEITIDGVAKTAAEWITDGTIDYVGIKGGRVVLHKSIDSDADALLARISKVKILAGFEWVRWDTKNWKAGALPETPDKNGYALANVAKYQTVENAVVKEDITLSLHKVVTENGDGTSTTAYSWVRDAQSIAVVYDNTPVVIGDVISTHAVTVTAKFGDKTWIVSEDYYKVECDTTSEGEKAATVTYSNGVTQTFKVTVNTGTAELTGIEIAQEPDKLIYELGDYEFSVTGLKVTAVYTVNGQTVKQPLSEKKMQDVAVSGYDYAAKGKQTITVSYQEKEATFEVTVNYDGSYGMKLDWSFEESYIAEKNSRNLCVRIDLFGKDLNDLPAHACMVAGGTGNLGTQDALIRKIVQDDFLDYILINGRTATEWVRDGQVDWVGWFGRQFVITLKPTSMLCYSDLDVNYDSENPETTPVITNVTFKAGLQYYATSVDNWPAGSAESASKIFRAKYAILTEDVTLYNDNGFGWQRTLKQDDQGNTLADALTIKSMPTKVEYEIGDRIDVSGMVLAAKYQDGGVEDVAVQSLWVDGFDSKTAGKKTLTVTYSDGEVTFEVTVKEASSENPGGEDPGKNPGGENPGGENPEKPAKKGCNGSGVAGVSLLCGGMTVLAAAVVVVLAAKKRNNR